MFNKLWERYFLREFAKVFFLFLFCFYGLYILIDYASHTSALPHHQSQIHGHHVLRYYFYILSSRIEILIPVALLIALVKTVCTLNTQRELVAFMASGFKMQTLMRPFLLIGLGCTLLIFANEQFILPTALRKLRRIEDASKAHKPRYDSQLAARNVVLEDGSLLLYQSYNTAKEMFFDAYWVKSADNIFRIKYLSPQVEAPVGSFVDHLVRQSNGQLIQEASYPSLAFPDMHFNSELLQSAIIEPEVLPLTVLGKQVAQLPDLMTEKESKLLTAFYWKMTIPWLCLLAVLGPMSFCVGYSRQFPVFLVYVASLFGLIAFYLYLDAVLVVANRQILTPFSAIAIPYAVAFAWALWRFQRMR